MIERFGQELGGLSWLSLTRCQCVDINNCDCWLDSVCAQSATDYNELSSGNGIGRYIHSSCPLKKHLDWH